MAKKVSTETKIRNIRRKTWRLYTAEEKIRIVLEGLQGESTVAELCRRESINQNLYYRWSKEFLEAGKQRLNGNTQRQADTGEDGDHPSSRTHQLVDPPDVGRARFAKKHILRLVPQVPGGGI